MSLVDAYVDRIRDRAPSFNRVERARSTKPLENFDDVPAALIYLAAIVSDQNTLDIGVRQEKQINVSVLLVCQTAEIEDLRRELEAALLGWSPSEGDDLVEHESAEVVEVQGRITWWRETFTHRSYR